MLSAPCPVSPLTTSPIYARPPQAGPQGTPRLLSTIAMQHEAEDEGDDVAQERWGEGGSEDASLELEGGWRAGAGWAGRAGAAPAFDGMQTAALQPASSPRLP